MAARFDMLNKQTELSRQHAIVPACWKTKILFVRPG